MAQLVERPTLDVGSGHDLMARGIEPHIGVHAGHGTCLILSPLSVPTPLACTHTLFLSETKKLKKKQTKL